MKEINKGTQEFKHAHKECLCYHCNTLQKDSRHLKTFEIKNRFGKSLFAHEHFTIQLCSQCALELEIEIEWFDNDSCLLSDGSYLHEHYIVGMVETFPIENQEYIFNCYNDIFCDNVNGKRISREDWIEDNS